ncbi:MAG TPA: DUF4012 domain-containing protein [Acidimicrobiales bacterium]|nr:DUF4012 domain-containing protein [Acidimicrobiales bacterium]
MIVAGAWAAIHLRAAAGAGADGRDALARARSDVAGRRLDEASRELAAARRSFDRMAADLHRLGPLLPVARRVPFVRLQVGYAEALADAGRLLARSGEEGVAAATPILRPSGAGDGAAGALVALRRADDHLRRSTACIDAAAARLRPFARDRLVGPLGRARSALARDLPDAAEQVGSAERGLRALLAFAGDSGPRRYLVFSQNPDEVRPTGGYLGSYGVLAAADGRLVLERYDSIESWYGTHPRAVVPPERAALPLRVPSPPMRQTIANANASAEWPAATRLAMDLWRQGGEAPVDGALAVTPEFLARLLSVLGPLQVPAFGDIVTAENLLERLDYHTHLEGSRLNDPNRKQFLTALAPAVLHRLLDARSAQWADIASALAAGFSRREAMAWTTDAGVNQALAEHRWDGALPVIGGDFFFDAEFAYKAKNGRGLHRTFDHHVVLRPDGSGVVTTTVTIENTRPFSAGGLQNLDSASYLTIYGPAGAALDPASDPPAADEEPVARHPAAAWLRSAAPLGSTTLTVTWQAPRLAAREADGSLTYSLWWMHLPAHAGDVLRLRVDLPRGWRWRGAGPPAGARLDDDVVGSWSAARS